LPTGGIVQLVLYYNLTNELARHIYAWLSTDTTCSVFYLNVNIQDWTECLTF
jgi:hypothetical protein